MLTRKVDEAICIEGGIKVVVLGYEYGRIKLGIEAPHGLQVLREELMAQPASMDVASSSGGLLRRLLGRITGKASAGAE